MLVLIITTAGMREFVLYTSAPERAKAKFEQLKTLVITHELQFIIQADKDWSVFKSLGKC